MKFKNTILYAVVAFAVALTLNACNQVFKESPAQALSLSAGNATGVYLTKDQDEIPVLCWTEQMGVDSLYYLRYARYDKTSETFTNPITISGSAGSTISAESMGKVAFKSDGTVVAVFAKRFPAEKNPYAGAIYYSSSVDQGKTWSAARFIHTDTAHRYGRSFFDLSRLANGELAAVWLDGRFGKAIKGSALFFANTVKGGGFATDICLQKGTCECCRTNIISDAEGKIHIAYRSIMYPNSLLGTQVRDMAYLSSSDNGKTFTSPQTISEDHWEIDGCPHSGPSMASNGQGLNALWFTAGGKPGIYFSTKGAASKFLRRTLLSESGRHPQMTTLKNEKLALVFEEGQGNAAEAHGAHGHAAIGLSKIVLTIMDKGKEEKRMELSEGEFSNHHAVCTSFDDGLLVAWTSEHHGQSLVYYRYVANL